MMMRATMLLLLLGASARYVHAQASAGMTSAVGRARSLVDGGDGAGARTLLDSLVARAEPSSDDMAEALYWRAVLSERAADGERDWKRLVVEAPLAPRVPDALLRLGELEILRGRPAVARAHFERIVRDFADSPPHVNAMIWIARSYFEERDLARACEASNALRSRNIPDGELRLQADELRGRCVTAVGSTATAVGGTATAVGGTSTAVDRSGSSPTAVAGPTTAVVVPPTAVFSLQFGAYDTRAQATALVSRLAKRGIKARIDGDRKPFRVRAGRYETRAEATAMLARLRKQGQGGFVAELGR